MTWRSMNVMTPRPIISVTRRGLSERISGLRRRVESR